MNEEAIEGGLLPGTPEIINSEEHGRNSTGKPVTEAAPSLSKDDGKILPHYLRASVGSCHDFCKYGRKNSLKLRGKHRASLLFARSHTTPEKEQNRVKILSLSERQKKSAIKQKASTPSKAGVCDKYVILEEESPSPPNTIQPAEETEINTPSTLFLEKTGLSVGPEGTSCNSPSPSNKSESFGGFASIKEVSPFEDVVLCNDPETSTQESSPVPKKSEGSENSVTASIKNPSKGIDSFLVTASAERGTGSSRKAFSSLKPKIMQKVSSPVKKAISLVKSKVSNREASSPAKRADASVKPAPPEKSKATTLKSVSPLNPTSGTNRKDESKRIKTVDLPNHVEKKTPKPLSASLLSQTTLNRVPSFTLRRVKLSRSSSGKHPKKVEKTEPVNDKTREKTLYVIEPRSAVDKYQAARSGPSSSSVSKHGRAKIKKAAQNEDKKSWGKVVNAHSAEKDPNPHKLDFRRGKVVNPQPVNDGPKRLRFRQGRRMGDNQSGKEAGKRSFKSKELACGGSNHPCPEAQIVVLKHQDVPEKKETQGLLNLVIEETASKLVETRKSKVKALVGAFETVISLQESRPAPSV